MPKSIAIDEEGYFVLQNGLRFADETAGQSMFKKMQIDEYGVVTLDHDGEQILVEPFDKPFVVSQIYFENDKWEIELPYHTRFEIDIESFCLDTWDRFHGLTKSGMPFVLTRKAQAELFNLASDFSDDSITLNNKTVSTEDFYLSSAQTNQKHFWSNKYKEIPSPPWNLESVHPELKTTLQQLKLPKSRILVPGCGFGHDAAFLAEQGHIVTAIDFSKDAISKAKERYGHIKNLNFEVADVFQLNESYFNAYEIIFEHTLYCAITPDQRANLIKIWKRCLTETGHLLGLFFVMPKRTGPPFGGSEWELRDRLDKSFSFLYWTRLQFSPGWRNGAELMVYAQVKQRP